MIDQVLIALENLALVAALRNSTFAYPLVNAGHILGIALLVGGIVPLDFRLLGVWRRVPVMHFIDVLRTTAAVGLGLAVICGLLLFATAAEDYAGSTLFLAKILLVVAGASNALILSRLLRSPDVQGLPLNARMPLTVRAGALLSLAFWISALILGRLLGYF